MGNTLIGGGIPMIKLLKSLSLDTLRDKLTLLYILNALDIVFTFGLLKTGLFKEINSLMISVVDSPWLSIMIKLIIPALLIIYILFRLEELPETNMRLCHICVNIVLLIYTAITIMHLSYLCLFLYTL